jgi:hypothetical protein
VNFAKVFLFMGKMTEFVACDEKRFCYMCGGTVVDENMGAVLSALNKYLFPGQHGTFGDLIRYFFGAGQDVELPNKRYVLKSTPGQVDIICNKCLQELAEHYKREIAASGRASLMLAPKDGC